MYKSAANIIFDLMSQTIITLVWDEIKRALGFDLLIKHSCFKFRKYKKIKGKKHTSAVNLFYICQSRTNLFFSEAFCYLD